MHKEKFSLRDLERSHWEGEKKGVLSKESLLFSHVNTQVQSQVHAQCQIYNVIQTMSHLRLGHTCQLSTRHGSCMETGMTPTKSEDVGNTLHDSTSKIMIVCDCFRGHHGGHLRLQKVSNSICFLASKSLKVMRYIKSIH